MGENNHDIGRWISILYRHGQTYISSQVKDLHIGSGQYIYLLALYKNDGINQETLSNYLKVDKGTTARAISKLEKEGYVYRVVDREDRRANRVFITDKAIEIQPAIYKVLREWNEIIVSNLSDAEKGMVQGILKNMVDNALSFMTQDGYEYGNIGEEKKGVQNERKKL